MKIIVRYTLLEILSPFLLALLAFNGLLIVDKVFDLTKYFVEKGVNLFYMIEMLFYFLPAVIVLTVPMAYLVGIVTAYGRLAADNEIIAMKTSGINMSKLIIPLVIISFFLSIFMVFFMDITIPAGNKAYTKLNFEIRRKNPMLVLEPGNIMEEMSREDKKWYFESIDPKTKRLKNIRIWERASGVPKLITAEEGELHFFDKWTTLKLYNGTIQQADADNPKKNYVLGKFAQDEVYLDISSSLDKSEDDILDPRNMSMKEIREELKKIQEKLASPNVSREMKKYIRKNELNVYLVEYYKKTSIPFACLAFGLIGVPIGLIVRRGGRMIGLGIGVGLIIIYYIFLTGGEKISKAGLFPALFGAWTPNILTMIMGIILIIRTIRETPIHSSKLINKLFPPKDSDNLRV